MNQIANDILMHYGTPRHSGRYPWGSGDEPYQHSCDFLNRVDTLRRADFTYTDKNGHTYTGDTAIAYSMGLNTSQFRTELAMANSERRSYEVAKAKALREKGYTLREIADEMGFNNDSSVRSLLNAGSEARMNQAKITADALKEQVDTKGMIDIGAGVERNLGVSKERLKEAVHILEEDGYLVYGGRVPQVTNKGNMTTLKVLCPPGTEHKEIYDFDKIHYINDVISHDGGETFTKFRYPKSLDSKRLEICYAEDGGINKDGVVEIRRGVPDLSLGESRYSQVRILVDGKKYIKGMAVYADDLPDGIDIRFNTNKSKSVPKLDVLKDIKNDPDNPFGSLIKEHGGQSTYIDKNGKEQLSLINKRADEGDWEDWSKKLPSQFLAKQNRALIKRQLDISVKDKHAEFEEIMEYTNPTVKKVLLKSFADDCDAAAVHLKAAALPRQRYQVILPLISVKDNEIYAPNYKDGETVALVRYPHGGTFEIPILKVNNKNKEGRRVLGLTPADAVGINKKVADRLSGADFDGDTVMVIPTGKNIKITSTPPLKGLEGFDTKLAYGADKVLTDASGKKHYYRGDKEYKLMTNTQNEMGMISNLITDMTLKGANTDELARAVRHSMVVIDAEKHHLDYKQSEIDNNIASLKKSYKGSYDEEGKYHEGASTLLSRAKSPVDILKRRGQPKINKKGTSYYDPSKPEGALIFNSVEEYYVDKNGKTKKRMQKSTRMAEATDAHKLSSGTPQEEAYADYANSMKALANESRKAMIYAGKIPYSANAKSVYSEEVKSLNDKLGVSLMNAPRERHAQLLANSIVKAKVDDNPDLKLPSGKSDLKKIKQQALVYARNKVGAERVPVEINDKEWEAIQAGAITETKLLEILNHTDIDKIRERATPRTTTALSTAKQNHIKVLEDAGYTTAQIASKLNISSSTVNKYLKGKE